MSEQNYEYSSYREKLIEHLFVSELMRLSWLEGSCDLEVAMPEVDAGCDVIAESNGFIRHIQLKSSTATASTARVPINTSLAQKPSGCVVWIVFDADTGELDSFRWFGGAPGEPLPDLSGLPAAKHTKANAQGVKAERKNTRILSKGKFTAAESVVEIYALLFGKRT